MKPVCANCHLFFQAEKSGFYFEEGMPVSSIGCPPTDSDYAPYKLWVGDLWKCRGCGARVIVGVSQNPIVEHFQPDYTEMVKRFNPQLRVDDC